MNELEFFEDCAKEVIACRQVLKYTYVVDYYARNLADHEKHLFKYQQAELENACEGAHKLLESDLNPYLDVSMVDRKPFYLFRSDVINTVATLRQSFKTLILDTQKNPKF